MNGTLAFLRIGIVTGALAGLAACVTRVPLDSLPPPPAPTAAPIRIEPEIVVPPMAALRKPEAAFALPARGPVMCKFDGRGSPGVEIAGRVGDPVFASRAGRVVIVSSALPAYGTMIVIKHDDTFITAYAQLGKTLVRESEEVIQGQQIAELPGRASERVALHFEIRKMGVAVDPEPYLQGTAR